MVAKAKKPLFPIALDPETKDRWAQAAVSARMSLAEFVRQAVEDKINGAPTGEAPQEKRPARAAVVDALDAERGAIRPDLEGFRGPDPKVKR